MAERTEHGMGQEMHRARQDTLLKRLLEELQSSPWVLGVTASGSYARGDRDAFSDLDLTCYLRDSARTGRAELHAAVAARAPTLSVLYLYDVHGLYLYADGVRLDLDFKPPEAVTTDSRTANRILYDPDGMLVRDLGRAEPPA